MSHHSNHDNGGSETFQTFPMMMMMVMVMMRMMRKRRIGSPFISHTLMINTMIWTADDMTSKKYQWQMQQFLQAFLRLSWSKRARNACTQRNMMRIKQTNMNLISEKYLWKLKQHLPARFLLSRSPTIGGWRGGEGCSVSFAHLFGRRAKIF